MTLQWVLHITGCICCKAVIGHKVCWWHNSVYAVQTSVMMLDSWAPGATPSLPATTSEKLHELFGTQHQRKIELELLIDDMLITSLHHKQALLQRGLPKNQLPHPSQS